LQSVVLIVDDSRTIPRDLFWLDAILLLLIVAERDIVCMYSLVMKTHAKGGL